METLKRFWNWLLGKTTVDEKVVATVKEAKKRVKAVKEEIAEAKEAISEAVEQAKDVVEAAQGKLIEGKVTKSKLNAIKKGDLLQHAKDEFGKEFDSKMPKSTLVNKIYGLHKGK
jgi:anion-transporting  ArsA/GET3 family ATPase